MSKKLYKSILFIIQIVKEKDKLIISNRLSQYIDSNIQKIIYFYLNIFWELLLSISFLNQSIFYKIDIENIVPININIYLLSDKKFCE